LNKQLTSTELYNLAEDPNEQRNVAAEWPEVVQKIEQIMRVQHVNSDVFPIISIDR
jgi:hypothetical protein